ncbi:MAG: basic amino acid ABC transporter substrate-binding protein [Synechococcales cyanobacterium C42_A2020_086]|jgi:arginine/lysine/histidine/glutamine transport system substrate-binding/permease protein|nr:basic amino acid ABC transporter substrate-binding protein [Synechococcales cyanobacterium C42_A2020_086]
MLSLSRSRLRFLISSLLSFVCVLLVAACSTDAPTSEAVSPAADPAAVPVLRVAVNPAFPPFEFKAADGSLQGFDIDLINAIGGTAGFLIDFDELSFDDLIRNLYGGQVDVAISAITINRDRSERVAFSRPYFKSGLAIAIREADTDITAFDSLNGKRVGVERGTTSELKAQTLVNADVKRFASAPQALQDLAAGRLDAVINDAPVTLYAIQSGSVSGLKLLDPLLSEEFYGIAVPKDSPYLEPINAALTTLIDNGTYAQIYQRWFAAEPPPLPDTAPL